MFACIAHLRECIMVLIYLDLCPSVYVFVLSVPINVCRVASVYHAMLLTSYARSDTCMSFPMSEFWLLFLFLKLQHVMQPIRSMC